MMQNKEKIGIKAYIALILLLASFSGLMPLLAQTNPNLEFLKALDFMNLLGKFGALGTLEEGCGTLASNFQGMNGSGPRNGFLVALGLIPSIMVANGLIKTGEDMGALTAAGKLLSGILYPIMGVPGECAVSVVSSLQSTDAGPITVHSMIDAGIIKERHRMILTAFQYSGAGVLANYFILGATCSIYFQIPVSIPLAIILLSKYVGSQLMRILTARVIKVDGLQEGEGNE